ncbi:hypothetical protein [Massilia sp. CF038]|uniref:hypothetical protein n=1 Tax=Massilia sp. CF038 TaxID=1881045 RepID=UPI00091C1D00|nr:hypothetical protein [Massilia sp. CF038]SHH08626.1 hypothetical protein SAMN05428948_2700 [Massilia sp. CF038]
MTIKAALHPARLRRYATAALAALLLLMAADTPRASTTSALAALPSTMLWAWERPEDLRWLPPGVGVAYVAVTVELVGAEGRLRRRAYPLRVPPGSVVVPMVHVDAAWRTPPTLNTIQRDLIVEQVLQQAQRSSARVVQLDFEVRASQRAFLREVLAESRRRLPADVALSATALASWCAGDYWIAGLAADEIVPMAFRMASDDSRIRTLLADKGAFTRPRCGAALGMATDEAPITARSVRRYFFSPRAWDQATWRRIQ